MSKRRATEELYTGDTRKRHDASPGRAVEFTAHLRALNSHFAQWVQEQAGSNSDLLWLDGAKEYVQFAEKLLDEYGDLIKAGRSCSSPPLSNNLFSTPGPAAAVAGNSDAHTNRSTGAAVGGRKSVSFAATPTFSAAADGPLASTPGPANFNLVNTANAGHTPAPPSGLGFTFGATPGPSNAGTKDLPSPEPFKWGSSTSAGITAREAEPSSSAAAAQSGTAPAPEYTFGISPPTTTPSAAAATAAAPPASASKAFSFGVSTNKAPAADSNGPAAGFTPAASPLPSSTGGFTFGATPSAGNGDTPGEAATSSTPAGTFTFGVLPSTSAAAAAPSSTTPTFSFGTGAGAAGGAAGTSGAGFFKFPAPSATAAGDAGGEGEGAGEEAPPKYKPEITVDESTWNVFFNGKARLHVRRATAGKNDWDSKGIGVLTVRQRKDGSDNSTYVTFTNDGGKQLVSSRLRKNTDVHIVREQPKKCRISLTVVSYEMPPAGQSEASNAAASTAPKYSFEVCMISLSSEEKMLELQKAVNEHKPK